MDLQFLEVLMTKTSTEELRRKLSSLLGRVAFGGERLLVTKNKKAFAAIVSLEDLKLIEEIGEEIEDRHDRAVIRKRRREMRSARPLRDVKRDSGLK